MSIISINGRLNSGKDTVGKIIQYLLIPNKGEHIGFQTFSDDALQRISGWEIKKFADKLKDIICILIGCTREQLEDQNFKATELGEEWWYWETGDIFGKLNYLDNKDLFKSIPLAKLVKPTPRLLLQLVGTEGGRDLIHPNIWVNSLMSEYKWDGVTMTEGWIPTYNNPDNSGGDLPAEPVYPNWIITDMRFPNELDTVKQKGGISIRVKRRRSDVQDEKGNDLFFDEKGYLIQEHPSETSLDNSTFDYEIENNGTIEELIEKVRIILIQENLL